MRDRFWPVASPKLLGGGKAIGRPSDLLAYPLVHAWWPDTNPHAPTWQRWLVMAQRIDDRVLLDMSANGLTFSEELHAIDAVIARQGVGLLSDVLVAHELATGEIVGLLDLALPGFGFYLAHPPDHPRQTMIDSFAQWIRSVR